jgi:Domain of unknown function (DUF4136)
MRITHFAALALAAATASSCATTMTVSSHVRPGLDMAQYRTYDWGPADALPTGDPRLDKDASFRDRVQGAVERQLAAKGIQLSSSGMPDLLIHYHARVDTRIDVNRTEREYGYCQGATCDSWVIEYEAGTLVLDIIDARNNRLIWRGWAQDSVQDVVGDSDSMGEKIDEAVSRMLARFPGR